MSAPDTNVEKQESHHRPSLMGTKGAIGIAVVILIALVGYNVLKDSDDVAVTGPEATTVPTDTYAPGTNSSATPTATD